MNREEGVIIYDTYSLVMVINKERGREYFVKITYCTLYMFYMFAQTGLGFRGIVSFQVGW